MLLHPAEANELRNSFVDPLAAGSDHAGQFLLRDGELEFVLIACDVEQPFCGSTGHIEKHRVSESLVDHPEATGEQCHDRPEGISVTGQFGLHVRIGEHHDLALLKSPCPSGSPLIVKEGHFAEQVAGIHERQDRLAVHIAVGNGDAATLDDEQLTRVIAFGEHLIAPVNDLHRRRCSEPFQCFRGEHAEELDTREEINRDHAVERNPGPSIHAVQKHSDDRYHCKAYFRLISAHVFAWSTMTFDVGDKVVYPHHGAATIEKREKITFAGEEKEYLVLKLAFDQLTLKVPVDKVEEVGLREVINDEEVEEVFAVLSKKEARMPTNWSRRFKNHVEKLKSGDIYQVAEVVRNLSIRDKDKGLSAGEKRMLVKARLILVSELTFALNVTQEEAEKKLSDALV